MAPGIGPGVTAGRVGASSLRSPLIASDEVVKTEMCPLCDHAVEHAVSDVETARLAIVSHLVRVHGMTETRLLLEYPALSQAASAYFGS